MAYGASAAAYDSAHSPGIIVELPMAAEDIYEGTLLEINASGYVQQVSDTDALVFAGVAAETKKNSGGSAGDKKLKVRITGIVELKSSGLALSNVGGLAYVALASVDAGQTVLPSTAGTNPVVVGRFVEYISATKGRVLITGFAFGPGAAPNGTHS